MHKNKYLLLAITFFLSMPLVPLFMKPGIAGIPGTEPISFWNPPADGKAPTTSRGGASREGNSCGFAQTKSATDLMTPLMPKTNIGLTQMGRPAIFVYLPKSIAKEALFTMEDGKGNKYYQKTLTLPQKSGVMKINIPDSASELIEGEKYHWSLLLVCGEEIEPDSPYVEGWIKRVSRQSNTISQNKPLTLESVKDFAQAGLWFDMLNALVELRQSQPKNMEFKKTWQALLEHKTVGLQKIAEQPFIN